MYQVILVFILITSYLTIENESNYHHRKITTSYKDHIDVKHFYRDALTKTKLRYAKSRIGYYTNSQATFQLILSGDIQTNPGPTTNKNKAPLCPVCEKPVRCNVEKARL